MTASLSNLSNLSALLGQPRFRKLCLAAACLMYATIVVWGSIPGARADIGRYLPGYVLHAGAYAILAVLWFLGSSGSPAARARKAVLAVAVMGAGDEFVQSFFPYRGADVRDWAVDCASAIVTSTFLAALLRPHLPAQSPRL